MKLLAVCLHTMSPPASTDPPFQHCSLGPPQNSMISLKIVFFCKYLRIYFILSYVCVLVCMVPMCVASPRRLVVNDSSQQPPEGGPSYKLYHDPKIVVGYARRRCNPSTQTCTFRHSDTRVSLCCGSHMRLPVRDYHCQISILNISYNIFSNVLLSKLICNFHSTKFFNYL